MALFAPGWVYEGEGNSRAGWRTLNERLWSSLAAVLGPGRPIITRLPFLTTFDSGAGPATWHQASFTHHPGSHQLLLYFLPSMYACL